MIFKNSPHFPSTNNPLIQVVIPRSRSESHMAQNLKASELIMLDSEYLEIDDLRR